MYNHLGVDIFYELSSLTPAALHYGSLVWTSFLVFIWILSEILDYAYFMFMQTINSIKINKYMDNYYTEGFKFSYRWSIY